MLNRAKIHPVISSIHSFQKFSKKSVLVCLFLVAVVLQQLILPSPVQALSWSPNSSIEGGPKELVVGDRVNVTLKLWAHNNVPIIRDQRFTFKILNPKPGQECTTTDDNLKEDGEVKGYCEAKGDPGNMEIYVDTDQRSTFEVNGEWYEPFPSARYNAMFNDPKVSCSTGPTAPSAVVILKQNDVTVRMEWQHLEGFVGTYDVLYGNNLGEYPYKRRSSEKIAIIDGLDPNKIYYFKVQASSACKWTATSKLFKYLPKTGAVSEATEKSAVATASAKPRVATPSASLKPSPVATTAASIAPTPTPETTPKIEVATAAQTSEPSLPMRIFRSISAFFQKLKFW